MSQPIPSETAAPRKRLGRGLSGLLGEIAGVEPLSDVVRGAQPQPTTTIREIPTTSIGPSPFQPRRVFDQDALARLAESIKAAGIMQPILLRRATAAGGPEFELVAGERRWRAATLAGLATVPAVVSELDDARAAQWALIENLQRQDLGAMERAWALRGLCERFGLTQAQAAERVGLDRTTVTNLIRVTELEAEVREMLDRGELSLGHGKALLAAPPGPERVGLASRAAAQRWSVRRTEQEASAAAAGTPRVAKTSARAGAALEHASALKQLEEQLGAHLGTKVRVRANASRTRGRLMIEFYDLDHFDGLMLRMGFHMK